jgi:hypothetical protein
MLRQNIFNNANSAESSKTKKIDKYASDDPFTDVITKNIMPTPPSKAKKVYLEDYENFTVK